MWATRSDARNATSCPTSAGSPRRPSGIAAATWAGGKVDHRTYPGRDHVGVVTADSALIPDLMRWTRARLDGQPARVHLLGLRFTLGRAGEACPSRGVSRPPSVARAQRPSPPMAPWDRVPEPGGTSGGMQAVVVD
jgi:hypothetical protein